MDILDAESVVYVLDKNSIHRAYVFYSTHMPVSEKVASNQLGVAVTELNKVMLNASPQASAIQAVIVEQDVFNTVKSWSARLGVKYKVTLSYISNTIKEVRASSKEEAETKARAMMGGYKVHEVGSIKEVME